MLESYFNNEMLHTVIDNYHLKIRNMYISFWAILSLTFGWLFFPKNFSFFFRFACFFSEIHSFLFLDSSFSFRNIVITGESVKIADFLFFRPLVLSFLGAAFSEGRRFFGRGSTFSVIEL